MQLGVHNNAFANKILKFVDPLLHKKMKNNEQRAPIAPVHATAATLSSQEVGAAVTAATGRGGAPSAAG